MPYTTAPLTPSHSSTILHLFQQCADYFLLAEDKVPDAETVRELFEDYPETHHAADKWTWGVYDQGHLVGVVDVLRGYAVADQWMIGLLLLAPPYRRLGWGRRLHEEIVQRARADGARSLRVGVALQNEAGLAFWKTLGYVERRRTAPLRFGHRDSVLLILERNA